MGHCNSICRYYRVVPDRCDSGSVSVIDNDKLKRKLQSIEQRLANNNTKLIKLCDKLKELRNMIEALDNDRQ